MKTTAFFLLIVFIEGFLVIFLKAISS